MPKHVCLFVDMTSGDNSKLSLILTTKIRKLDPRIACAIVARKENNFEYGPSFQPCAKLIYATQAVSSNNHLATLTRTTFADNDPFGSSIAWPVASLKCAVIEVHVGRK